MEELDPTQQEIDDREETLITGTESPNQSTETGKAIRDIVDVPTSQRSNFPSRNSYVVQAWSNVDGWQDSKEGATTPETAFLRARMLLDRDSSWMGEHRLVRIVPTVKLL